MANSFINSCVEVLTSSTNLYTCPAATQSIINNLHIGNKDGAAPVNVDVTFFDGSNTFTIAANLSIPVGSFIQLERSIHLTAGQQINVQASALNRAVAFASILNVT